MLKILINPLHCTIDDKSLKPQHQPNNHLKEINSYLSNMKEVWGENGDGWGAGSGRAVLFVPSCAADLFPSRGRLTENNVNARPQNPRGWGSSFISDATGYAIQHLQYLPFGEAFVDQQAGTFDSRYKFSAKEKDDETQYSYFGARYYDSDLSVWLSVDPLSDKYPNLSPYAYCANNPVVLIDPDGEFKTPFGAYIYKVFHGGDVTPALNGEYYVMSTLPSRNITKKGTHQVMNYNPDCDAAVASDVYSYGVQMKYSWFQKDAVSKQDEWLTEAINNIGSSINDFGKAAGGFIKMLDDGGGADGANAGSAGEQAPVAIKAIANINPLFSISNIASWGLFSGRNHFNEKPSDLEKVTNAVDLATFGASYFLSKPVREIIEAIVMPSVDATSTVIDEETK